jgi:hypothetical protein
MERRRVPPDLPSCCAILEKLCAFMPSNFFFNFTGADELPHAFLAANPDPPSLAGVAERLSGGAYATPDAFYDAVLAVFDPLIDFYAPDLTAAEAQLFWALALTLKQKFLKLCKKACKSENARSLERLQRAVRECAFPCIQDRPWAEQHCAEVPDGVPDKIDPQLYFDI